MPAHSQRPFGREPTHYIRVTRMLGQYLVFVSVAGGELADIGRLCEARHKSLRYMYLEVEGALTVKIMPGAVHGMVRTEFTSTLMERTARMGLRHALVGMRGTTVQGIESRKEANSAPKPRSSRPRITDWPTLVLECGIPESFKRLRAEARWWLDNSVGEVKSVLLFSISTAERRMHLERWEVPTVLNPLVTRADLSSLRNTDKKLRTGHSRSCRYRSSLP